MKIRNLRGKQGFTIIELMIVLAIVAILLALAYPSYIDYVRKSKRSDAQQALMNWAVNQEIWRANHTSYATTAQLPAPLIDNYDFATVGTPNATGYTLQASAKAGNDQNNDKSRNRSASCATMTLNQSGLKTHAGCWE